MRYSKIIIVFLITCAAIAAGIVSYYSHRYEQVRTMSDMRSIQEAVNQLSHSEREYLNLRDQVFSMVSLLSHGRSAYNYINSPNETSRYQFQLTLTSAAKGQKWFSDIGFIDTDGVDKVHITYSSTTQKTQLVEQDNDLSEDPLFLYAKSLSDDEVGTWSEDLTTDPEKLVKPYVPRIQVVTPVSIAGVRKGYIVISVDVSLFLDKLNYTPKSNLTPAIVGENGYLVTGRSLLPFYGDFTNHYHGLEVSRHFPKAWKVMQTAKHHYAVEDSNLIVFKTVENFFGQKIHLVIRFTPKQLDNLSKHALHDLIKEGFFVFVCVLVFVLPTVSMSLHYHHRNIESKLARAALDGMSAVLISDKAHKAMMVNREFETMMGILSEEIRGHDALNTLLSNNDPDFICGALKQLDEKRVWEGEVECITPEGNTLTTIMRTQAIIEAGKISYYITSIVDISERKALENKLRELSEKDALTHLWNRRKFELELSHHSELVEKNRDYCTSLCLIDIDYFKRINDEQGHDEGDRVIIKVSEVLMNNLRTHDFLSRIGGEEFALIMPQTSVSQAQAIAESLRAAVELDESLTVTISIGVSDLSKDSTRSYKCADIALYESKTLGRNQVSLFLTDEDIAGTINT